MLVTQADVEEIFVDMGDLKYAKMTNHHIVSQLVKKLQIERVSRTAAYNLLVAAKTAGVKKAAASIALSTSGLVDVTSEEDTIRMLTIRNKEGELLLCSVAKLRQDHIMNLAKVLPKREVHAGSVEAMLGKAKAPVMHGRSTVF